MDAQLLFERLDRDFILPGCSDDWSEIKHSAYYTGNFMKTYMGLALDNAKRIDKVYTAVFASERAIRYLIDSDISDALLFTHHPMEWNINNTPIFTEISVQLLETLKKRRISLYNLHVPLDRNSDFSTSVSLAHGMKSCVLEEFFDYHGCKVAVIAHTPFHTVSSLKAEFEKLIGHESKLYSYGNEKIENATVAFCGGGGNEPELYEFMAAKGVNTYITGVTSADTGYSPAVKAHENAKKCGINIIGGTHYSTEKFACVKMAEYFGHFDLSCEFILDIPCYEDM